MTFQKQANMPASQQNRLKASEKHQSSQTEVLVGISLQLSLSEHLIWISEPMGRIESCRLSSVAAPETKLEAEVTKTVLPRAKTLQKRAPSLLQAMYPPGSCQFLSCTCVTAY